MSRHTILFIFLLLGGVVHSQVSFYVRPVCFTKTNKAHFDEYFDRRHGQISDKRITRTNEYFTFINHVNYFYIGELNWGFHLGMNWGDKHSVELGYSTDHVALAMSTASNVVRVDTLTNVRYSYESSSYLSLSTDPTYMRKISASYAYKTWQNKHKTLQVRTLVGLGFLQTIGASFSDPLIQTMYSDPPDPASGLLGDVYMYPVLDRSIKNQAFSLFANVGIGLDFVSKKKHRNLFSVEIFYLHSRRIIYSHYFQYRVVDKFVSTDYTYALHSKGSGFYFNLTKKIQLYPWIWGKKKDSIE